MACVEGSTNRILVKIEKACKEVITLKFAQAVRITYVGEIAEDRGIRVKIGITLNVRYLAQSRA